MPRTEEEIKKEVLYRMAGIGLTEKDLDPNYIKAIASGQEQQYFDAALAQGKKNAQKSGDNYFDMLFGERKAQLQKAYDAKLKAIDQYLNNALKGIEDEKAVIEPAYQQQVGDINKGVYGAIERGKVVGANRGIMYSPQMMGQEAGIQRTGMQLRDMATQNRDAKFAEIQRRINLLRENTELEKENARMLYESGLEEARNMARREALARSDRYEDIERQLQLRQEDRQWQLEDIERQLQLRQEERQWQLEDMNRRRAWEQADARAQMEFQERMARLNDELAKDRIIFQNSLKDPTNTKYNAEEKEFFSISTAKLQNIVTSEATSKEKLNALNTFINDLVKDPVIKRNISPELRDHMIKEARAAYNEYLEIIKRPSFVPTYINRIYQPDFGGGL